MKFQVQTVRQVQATQDDSDDSDYSEGAWATKNGKQPKKETFSEKINRGEELIIAQNNQSSQQASAAKTMRNWNKN